MRGEPLEHVAESQRGDSARAESLEHFSEPHDGTTRAEILRPGVRRMVIEHDDALRQCGISIIEELLEPAAVPVRSGSTTPTPPEAPPSPACAIRNGNQYGAGVPG